MLYVVFLKFSNNKSEAGKLMSEHQAWLERGFDDGVFLLAGSIVPRAGGAILAHNTSRDELEARVREDPFVAGDVVRAELFEVSPSSVDPRLQFLHAQR